MADRTKKTRVTLPGSLADLVRDLQDGGNANGKSNQEQTSAEPSEKEESTQESTNAEAATSQQNGNEDRDNQTTGYQAVATTDTDQAAERGSAERVNRPIGSERQRGDGSEDRIQRGRPQKENTMKEYHVQKDDSADSWDLFLDLARQYKTGGGRPATIYIDPALKNILDRLKYPLSLTTSAMLSSIVARFIYDHEDDVRKAIFSQNIF